MTMRCKALWNVLALMLLVCGTATLAPAMAASPCTTASIDEPFVLPDGKMREPGQLKICLEEEYSPVASLHETRVEGMPIGMYITRHQEIESGDLEHRFLVFARNQRGQLCLLGYARPVGDHVRFFAFDHPSVEVEIGEFRLAVHPGWPLILVPARA
jgi:hypothetical protein